MAASAGRAPSTPPPQELDLNGFTVTATAGTPLSIDKSEQARLGRDPQTARRPHGGAVRGDGRADGARAQERRRRLGALLGSRPVPGLGQAAARRPRERQGPPHAADSRLAEQDRDPPQAPRAPAAPGWRQAAPGDFGPSRPAQPRRQARPGHHCRTLSPRQRDRPPCGGRSFQLAPSGRAGIRLKGRTWGVCGSGRREAPFGKNARNLRAESVMQGVRPSSKLPTRISITTQLKVAIPKSG